MSPRKSKKAPAKVDNKQLHDASFPTPPPLGGSKKVTYDKDEVIRMLLEGTAPVVSNGPSKKTSKGSNKKSPTETSGFPPAPVPTTPTKGGRKFYAGSMFDDSPAPGSLPKPSFLSEGRGQEEEEALVTPSRSLPRDSPASTSKSDSKLLLEAIMTVGPKNANENPTPVRTSGPRDNKAVAKPPSLLTIIKEGKKPSTDSNPVVPGTKSATPSAIEKLLERTTFANNTPHYDTRRSPRLMSRERPLPPPPAEILPKPLPPIKILRREQPRPDPPIQPPSSQDEEGQSIPAQPKATRIESLTDSFLRILRLKSPKK